VPVKLPTRSDTDLDRADLDLLANPVVRKDIPGIEEAFDAARMREHLNEALVTEAEGRYTIETCVPGHATYLSHNRCLLRYEIELRDRDGGQALPGLVNARVFGTQSGSDEYFEQRLRPLTDSVRGRPETGFFIRSATTVPSLNMAVSVFPIDGELPTLVEATQPTTLLGILRNALPDAQQGGFYPRDCRVGLGHYGRQHRCLLKYEVTGTTPPTDGDRSVLVYGKVAADGRGSLTGPVIEAIRDEVLARDPEGFAIPRSFGFIPRLQLVLLESIPGIPRVAQLLKARFKGKDQTNPEGATLEEAIDSCARVAALLHMSSVSVGERRSAGDEFGMLGEALTSIRHVSPGFGRRFERWLDDVSRFEAASSPTPACFSHGDFSYTQLIFDEKRSGLVDFDTMCQAEAALDLGHFLAYLRMAAMKSRGALTPGKVDATEALCDRFLEAYRRHSSAERASAALRRVPVYELISLMRLAFHSWQKFKPNRLEHVMAVLEERFAYHGIESSK
jgi:hypothetical protein